MLDEIHDLQKKMSYLDMLPPDPKYGIVARRIKDKQALRDKGHLAYDVEDF